jgi:glycosyltransferase involved in cell wall biosynthesis
MRDCLGRDAELTLVTVQDGAADFDRVGLPCTAFGAGGSRVRMGLRAVRLWVWESWDLVVLAHVNLAALATIADHVRSAPLLAIIHSLEAWRPIAGLRRSGLGRVDRLLYVSQHSRAKSHEANPWLSSLSNYVCHWGLLPEVDSPQVGAAGQALTNGSPDLFALSIGRMSWSERYKGHEEMLRLWPAVTRLRPGLRLVFIGDGDDRPRLEELAGGLRIDVQFLGSVDDATRNRYLERCQCFCLPTRGEGFGLVFLEAMRAGKPVLAGSNDAGCEVVVDGLTGRTVDPTNPNELLQGVLDVSGERAEKFGQAGRQRFAAHFSYDRFLDRFSRHVAEVTGKGLSGTR